MPRTALGSLLLVAFVGLVVLVALGSCAAPAPARATTPERETSSGVYALVLGTAQDAGLPQVGCFETCCETARRDPAAARLVASLLIADERSGKRWLVDCTPDIEAQAARAKRDPTRRPAAPDGARPALFDGIFLTHAHMGHYAGLLELGREGYGARALPVHGSEPMLRFLAANDPWALLVESGALELHRLFPGEPVVLADDLTLTPIVVPHRDELTDTLAFRIDGPERSLLYLPDVDAWERWDERIEDHLAAVDEALLDGTFFSAGELKGRSMGEVPHPLIEASLERFAALSAPERAKVLFTHLNHTNPAADRASAQARRVRAAGMGIAAEGQRIEL